MNVNLKWQSKLKYLCYCIDISFFIFFAGYITHHCKKNNWNELSATDFNKVVTNKVTNARKKLVNTPKLKPRKVSSKACASKAPTCTSTDVTSVDVHQDTDSCGLNKWTACDCIFLVWKYSFNHLLKKMLSWMKRFYVFSFGIMTYIWKCSAQ